MQSSHAGPVIRISIDRDRIVAQNTKGFDAFASATSGVLWYGDCSWTFGMLTKTSKHTAQHSYPLRLPICILYGFVETDSQHEIFPNWCSSDLKAKDRLQSVGHWRAGKESRRIGNK